MGEHARRRLSKALGHTNLLHGGIEVNGLEWSFGTPSGAGLPLVSCWKPKEHPQHQFRQSLSLGRTNLSVEKTSELLVRLAEEYPKKECDTSGQGCCRFADHLCKQL